MLRNFSVSFVANHLHANSTEIVASYLGRNPAPTKNPLDVIAKMRPGEFLVLLEPDRERRREIHEACDERLTHLSFHIGREPWNPRTLRWCEDCKRWLKENQTERLYCCTDEDGEPTCSSFVYTCAKCFDYDEGFLIGCKEKNIRTNNAILLIPAGPPDEVVLKTIRRITKFRSRTIAKKKCNAN